jgi:hypothetical protein
VSLDTVLRRFAAAQLLLAEFIMEESDQFSADSVRGVLRFLSPQLDRLLGLIADEHRHEIERADDGAERRRGELVERLLAGTPTEASALDYELDGWHLGVIASGPSPCRAVGAVQMRLGCRCLCVARGDKIAWAWLSGRRRISAKDVDGAAAAKDLERVSLALGEPAQGVKGFRLTHRQAQAAQWNAVRRSGGLTRYGADPLLAAALKDEVLAESLRQAYLAPLDGRGNGGALARATLRAYFHAGCNAATAAAALGVDRHTVQRRVRRIEDKLGRWLTSCRSELELALRLDELDERDEIVEVGERVAGASERT